jgi:hypothetical protein
MWHGAVRACPIMHGMLKPRLSLSVLALVDVRSGRGVDEKRLIRRGGVQVGSCAVGGRRRRGAVVKVLADKGEVDNAEVGG